MAACCLTDGATIFLSEGISGMAKWLLGCVLWCGALAGWAQEIPSVQHWARIFEEVRQHALFRDIAVRYAKSPAANVGYTPIGVVMGEGTGCKVVIAEGENPKMRAIMRFGPTPSELHTLMLTAAAHELGHCLRLQLRQMPQNLWSLVAAADPGTAERRAAERQASFEEAYADAYAMVYMRSAHPAFYAQALQQMRALRGSASFATAYYQVHPLYTVLERDGLDTRLPLQQQVDAAMEAASFSP
jgi:hypothetical protein